MDFTNCSLLYHSLDKEQQSNKKIILSYRIKRYAWIDKYISGAYVDISISNTLM